MASRTVYVSISVGLGLLYRSDLQRIRYLPNDVSGGERMKKILVFFDSINEFRDRDPFTFWPCVAAIILDTAAIGLKVYLLIR